MLHTVADPPYEGSSIRAIIGWTRNSIPAPKNAATANIRVVRRGGSLIDVVARTRVRARVVEVAGMCVTLST